MAIIHRWAEGHFDELDAMATELVADGVALIAATGGTRSAQSAKKATTTIPIVFVLGFDPVNLGLVASFNKPGGNITGTTIFTTELATKRLNLLYDPAPHRVQGMPWVPAYFLSDIPCSRILTIGDSTLV